MARKELTNAQWKEMRKGILMARRNFENNCNAPFDSQIPKGRIRSRAYFRSWVACVYPLAWFPPRASSTRRKPLSHGPTQEERMKQMWSQTPIREAFYNQPLPKKR